jgi:DNA-directed RNA polymerase subunit E'/Rpb7
MFLQWIDVVFAAMFVLTELQDTLRVPPQSLSIPLQDAITQEIANLYFDKVLRILRFKPSCLSFSCLGNEAVL